MKSATSMAVYHGFYADEGEDKGIDLYVPQDIEAFSTYVSLRERGAGDTITLNNDGAITQRKSQRIKI